MKCFMNSYIILMVHKEYDSYVWFIWFIGKAIWFIGEAILFIGEATWFISYSLMT